jgi:CubicO group peptidase (beta-lactamase class C family)
MRAPGVRSSLLVLALALASVAAARSPEAKPARLDTAARAGLDPARLARIAPRMQELVDAKRIAGAVTLVARKGVVAHHEAVGFQDLEARTPMRKDSIFQIMSMTKPVTGLAVMMLAEDGKLGLLDPVEKHLPEFKGVRVVVNPGQSAPDANRLVEPARPFTIRDLMTHTSGMGDYPPALEVYTKMDRSLEETIRETAKLPLLFHPGEKWSYSNPGIATLGRIVEVVSGQRYEEFLKERLFDPLGLKDTFFFPPADKTARIALVYRVENGRLERAPATILGGDAAKFRAEAIYPAPDFALYSTAPDLQRLHQMVLDEGLFEGRRYLSPASIRLMTSVHTGSLPAGWRSGSGFGLTYEVVRDAMGTLLFRSPGSFGHGGAFGTDGWIDPARRLVTLLLIQRSSGADADERAALTALAASAIVD